METSKFAMLLLTYFCYLVYRLHGMVECGDRHKHIYQRAMLLVEQVKVSKGSPLVTCLLEGSRGRYAVYGFSSQYDLYNGLFLTYFVVIVVKLHFQLLLVSTATSHTSR